MSLVWRVQVMQWHCELQLQLRSLRRSKPIYRYTLLRSNASTRIANEPAECMHFTILVHLKCNKESIFACLREMLTLQRACFELTVFSVTPLLHVLYIDMLCGREN